MRDRLAKLISTFFYCGECPWAPGTVGSLAGLLLYIGVAHEPLFAWALFSFLFVVGFFSANRAERIFGKKDPRPVVIDEVCGIVLVFLFVPLTPGNIIVGFIAYRLFDIFKPFPCRRLEKLPGAWGIMADDILCGVYTNVLLHLFIKYGVLKV